MQKSKIVFARSLTLSLLSLVALVAAFATGATALGMVLMVAAITFLGFGAGCAMNSPAPEAPKSE